MTLTEFLAARLDDDEDGARAATDGPWIQHDGAKGYPQVIINAANILVAETYTGPEVPSFEAAHIARHDPVRVLREVAFKRSVLERHTPHQPAFGDLACDWCSEDVDDRPQIAKERWPCPDIRSLAAIWSDHPDYQADWQPKT